MHDWVGIGMAVSDHASHTYCLASWISQLEQLAGCMLAVYGVHTLWWPQNICEVPTVIVTMSSVRVTCSANSAACSSALQWVLQALKSHRGD